MIGCFRPDANIPACLHRAYLGILRVGCSLKSSRHTVCLAFYSKDFLASAYDCIQNLNVQNATLN